MVRFQYHPASQMARMPSQVFKATDTADNMPVIMPRQHAKFYMKNVPIGDQVVFQVSGVPVYLAANLFRLGRKLALPAVQIRTGKILQIFLRRAWPSSGRRKCVGRYMR